MKTRTYSPFVWLLVLVIAISLACGPAPTQAVPPTQPPAPPATTAPEKPTEPPAPVATQAPKATAVPEGLVTSWKDLKKATIQIESQGTFIDPQVGAVVNGAGRGSGFIIDPSGIAVTNNHVVTGAALIKVWVGGDTSTTYNARVLGVSECSDLAVIDIEGDGFPYLSFYSGKPSVGLDIYAGGFPLGDPEFTLTKGSVSKEKTSGETSWASVKDVIEHTATINPGNSGGPLVDENGAVVGINYAGVSSTKQYFAIADDAALPVIQQLRAGNDVDTIGINGEAVANDDGSLKGIWVSSVKSGSPADKTGVKAGDILLSMENLYLANDGTMSEYCDILRTHKATDTLAIQVLRFATQEILDGQLNGRVLAVSSSFAQQLGGETNGANSGSTPTSGSGDYANYVKIVDDTGNIQVEVPEEWKDTNTAVWSSDWGGDKFDSPSITASADQNAYLNGFSEAGVFFAASKQLGQLGGYVELLDGVKGWYDKDCTFNQRTDYGTGTWADPWYEGKFDYWDNCGPDKTSVLVLAARPKDNPSAYLLLLEIKIVSERDLKALDHILQTFQANF